MRLIRRREPARALPPSFGEWLLHKFAPDDTASAPLPFPQLEKACSQAGSLLCGAVIARPEAFRGRVPFDADAQREAALVAKRTANGFQASLADRANVVLAWPWDHLATRVAWRAVRQGAASEQAVGDELLRVAGVYGLSHREQLEVVVALWEQVAAGVREGREVRLAELGGEMLAAYEREVGRPVSSMAPGG